MEIYQRNNFAIYINSSERGNEIANALANTGMYISEMIRYFNFDGGERGFENYLLARAFANEI